MARDPKSSYYDAGGIETLDIIRAKLTPEEYRGYLKGNALKYLCREAFKGSAERDLEKARHYVMWLAEDRTTSAGSRDGQGAATEEGTT